MDSMSQQPLDFCFTYIGGHIFLVARNASHQICLHNKSTSICKGKDVKLAERQPHAIENGKKKLIVRRLGLIASGLSVLLHTIV